LTIELSDSAASHVRCGVDDVCNSLRAVVAVVQETERLDWTHAFEEVLMFGQHQSLALVELGGSYLQVRLLNVIVYVFDADSCRTGAELIVSIGATGVG